MLQRFANNVVRRGYSTSQLNAKKRVTKVEEMNHLVFVYCTFKQGGVHDYVLANANSRLSAQTTDKYPMVVKDGLPYLLDFKGYGNQVNGTLYSVPTKTLSLLEKEMTSLCPTYERSMIPVEVTESGQQTKTQAYAFVRQQFPPELLSLHWNKEYVGQSVQRPQNTLWPKGIMSALTTPLAGQTSNPVLSMYSQSFQFAKTALSN